MCGIIGVSGVPDAARVAYLGLYSLQHRGQESAGLVAVDGEGVARSHRGMGLVADIFTEPVLAGGGWHVIEVMGSAPPIEPSIGQVRDRIVAGLRDAAINSSPLSCP